MRHRRPRNLRTIFNILDDDDMRSADDIINRGRADNTDMYVNFFGTPEREFVFESSYFKMR